MQSSFSTAGRVQPGESDVLLRPRVAPDVSLPGVVFCHSNGSDAWQPIDPLAAGINRVLRTLVEAGYPCISQQLGPSLKSLGNPTSQTRVGACRTYLQSTLGAASGPVILIGTSAGNTTILNYARNNPANVACVVSFLPLVDLDRMRVDNPGGAARGDVDAAWGVTYPAALPAGASPAASPTLNGVPFACWYASNDTIVPADTVTAYASAVGGTATSVGALGHTDTAIAAVPVGDVVAFITAHS